MADEEAEADILSSRLQLRMKARILRFTSFSVGTILPKQTSPPLHQTHHLMYCYTNHYLCPIPLTLPPSLWQSV